MIFLNLFITFFQIGIFSFGGGYAAMPLIQSIIVNEKHWLSFTEYSNLLTIAEMTPGPIAVNSATFVGQKIAGLPGAIISTFGCIVPSFFIVLFFAYLYKKFRNLNIVKHILQQLRPAVVAMISSAALTLLLLAWFGDNALTSISIYNVHWTEIFLFIIALISLRKKKAKPVQVIFGTAIIGTILYSMY